MIAHLEGCLVQKEPDFAVIDVNGVGYRVFIPTSVYSNLPVIGEKVLLQTVTQVREDAFHLYGFLQADEKALYSLLITVSGIGAKLALAALSTLTPKALVEAVRREDLVILSRIPGVGRKTAQRMVMELKDKVEKIYLSDDQVTLSEPAGPVTSTALLEDLISALVNLGFKRNQAERVSREVLQGDDPPPLEKAIGMALKKLSSAS
ncbi:Holliday junction branch migration protein RuvA [Magnetococcales bacterium HHB-1]